MNIVSTSKFSSVSQTAALISADLTPTKYQPAAGASAGALNTFQALPPESLTLKGNAAASVFDAPLTYVSVNSDTPLIDPSIFASIRQSPAANLDPHAPRTNAEAGDVLARFINRALGQWAGDMPNVDMNALRDTVQRVVRDVCAHFKPGDDYVGMIRAAVGLAMWGAGAPADVIADFGKNGIYPAFMQGVKGGENTPLLLAQDLYAAEQAWKNLPFGDVLGAGTFRDSKSVQTFTPVGDSVGWGGVDWTVSKNNPGDTEVAQIDGYDKIDNPIGSFYGPWSHAVSAQLTGSGIADLTLGLQGLWLSTPEHDALHDTIERVVRDVCERSKSGDDLLGNITTAVGFALWGAGYQPDLIASVTGNLSAVLNAHFPGDAEASLAAMGQFFHNHEAGDLVSENINPNDYGL